MCLTGWGRTQTGLRGLSLQGVCGTGCWWGSAPKHSQLWAAVVWTFITIRFILAGKDL